MAAQSDMRPLTRPEPNERAADGKRGSTIRFVTSQGDGDLLQQPRPVRTQRGPAEMDRVSLAVDDAHPPGEQHDRDGASQTGHEECGSGPESSSQKM